MKTIVLIMLASIMAFSVYPQKKPNLKSNVKSSSTIRIDQSVSEPTKTKPITTAIITPPVRDNGSRETQIVTVISIGTSANAYSYGYGGGQKSILYANNDLNTITHLHRMGGVLDPGGYSGDLGYDISTNGGSTWINMIECYTSTITGDPNLDAARYPNHGIYNPVGNTDPDDAYVTFFAPTLDATNGNWGGYGYGRASIGSITDTTKNLSHSQPPYYQYIPDAYDVSNSGIVIAVDVNQDWTSGSQIYQGTLIVSRGVWNESQEDFIFTRSQIDFPTNAENDSPVHVKFAFGPDGQTGWIAIITDNNSVTPLTGVRYFYPVFIKTTNGGVTWGTPFSVRLDGPDGLPGVLNYLTDAQIEELFEPPVPARDEIPYTTAFDCDLVVDKWGNPHMSVVVGVGGSSEYSIITGSETFAAFDISSTDGGTSWDGWMCGKAKQFRGTFGASYTEDNRIQASSTQDGEKIFITWLDTEQEGAEENNAPDIYARGIDVHAVEDYRCLSTDADGEDLPVNVTTFSDAMWQAHFAVTSRITLDDGSGTYTIPFSYEALDTPFDPGLPVQYKYIQDFEFTDDDFCGTFYDTADIDVIPTALTIYQETRVKLYLLSDTLTIFNVGDGELTITSISSNDQWILTSGYPNVPFEIDPGESQVVLVDIDWPLLGGENQTGILSISSDDYDEPVVDVSVTAVPADLPDLVIQDQFVDPAIIEAGDSTYVSCNVVNQGNAIAGTSTLKYYLSEDDHFSGGDIELGYDIVESLDSGQVSNQEDTLVIPSGTEGGMWFIIFFADAGFEVTESNENNNEDYFVINVQISIPDLVVQNQEVDTIIVEPGSFIEATCDIFNQGDGNASSSNLKYFLSDNNSYEGEDIHLGTDAVDSLEAGQSSAQVQELFIPGSTTPGDWFILFFADADDQVVESDENNNIAYVQIEVQTHEPDLMVQNQAIDPVITEPDSSIEATSNIYNQGNGNAGSSNLNYYLSADNTYEDSDLQLGTDTVGSLGPGEFSSLSQTLIIPSNTELGIWYILFYADADNLVTESDETNNIAYVPIEVQSPSTDILEIGEEAIKVYPNPACSQLNIDVSGMDKVPESIEIINSLGISGIRYINTNIDTDIITLSIKDLPSGIYFLRITFSNNELDRRILVIRK